MDNLIIYVISDSVGETAEQVTKAALSQLAIFNKFSETKVYIIIAPSFLPLSKTSFKNFSSTTLM